METKTRDILTEEKWDEMLEAMHSGETCECDEGVYWYFLEVLPPVFMNKTFKFHDGETVPAHFGFAEGSDLITVFWKENGRYFLRRSNLRNRPW